MSDFVESQDTDKSEAINFDVIESSFNLLAPKAPELVSRFYDELLSRYPIITPLFSGISRDQQEKKLQIKLLKKQMKYLP